MKQALKVKSDHHTTTSKVIEASLQDRLTIIKQVAAKNSLTFIYDLTLQSQFGVEHANQLEATQLTLFLDIMKQIVKDHLETKRNGSAPAAKSLH